MYVTGTYPFNLSYKIGEHIVGEFDARVTYEGDWIPGYLPDVTLVEFEVRVLNAPRDKWTKADALLVLQMNDQFNEHEADSPEFMEKLRDDNPPAYRYHDAAE